MSQAPSRLAPWSVAWTGETKFSLRPSADFPGKVELDQNQAPGDGEPQFASVHVTRQRRAMIDLLCHVCGQPTVTGDRYLFPNAAGGLVTLHDGSELYGCNVPPVHLACALEAMQVCPHLSRLGERPLRCDDADDGRLIERTDPPPGLEELAAAAPPGLEIVYSCYRLYGEAFTDLVLRARAAWNRMTREKRARGETAG